MLTSDLLTESTAESCDSRSAVCDWTPFYPLCQGNPPRRVLHVNSSCYKLSCILCNSYVIANDLSELATAAMRRNVELNGLGDGLDGKVRVNEGDAW